MRIRCVMVLGGKYVAVVMSIMPFPSSRHVVPEVDDGICEVDVVTGPAAPVSRSAPLLTTCPGDEGTSST